MVRVPSLTRFKEFQKQRVGFNDPYELLPTSEVLSLNKDVTQNSNWGMQFQDFSKTLLSRGESNSHSLESSQLEKNKHIIYFVS